MSRAALLALVLTVAGVVGLKDVLVSVPEAAAAGDTVTLSCRYDLEQDALYSLKWYRGREEFFRYIPKELPHTKVFPLPGVDVDLGRSGPSVVVLRSVTPPISGRYRCEVSADAPSFHTAMKSSYMHVVELPDSAPEISTEKTRVSVGDTIRVICTAPPAHPPANLTWLLNNNPITGMPVDVDATANQKPTKWPPTEYLFPSSRNATRLFGQSNAAGGNGPDKEVIGYPLRGQRNVDGPLIKNSKKDEFNTGPSSELPSMKKGTVKVVEPAVKKSSGSSLVLSIQQQSFEQGKISLTCRATVFSLYKAQAVQVLEEERPQIASVLSTWESSNGCVAVNVTKLLFLPLLLHFLNQ